MVTYNDDNVKKNQKGWEYGNVTHSKANHYFTGCHGHSIYPRTACDAGVYESLVRRYVVWRKLLMSRQMNKKQQTKTRRRGMWGLVYFGVFIAAFVLGIASKTWPRS